MLRGRRCRVFGFKRHPKRWIGDANSCAVAEAVDARERLPELLWQDVIDSHASAFVSIVLSLMH